MNRRTVALSAMALLDDCFPAARCYLFHRLRAYQAAPASTLRRCHATVVELAQQAEELVEADEAVRRHLLP